ncbi:single-stranded DNA-binding protein [Gloeothece verrucosa]|uniref:Single-stranded DNA-binding protein n=1 Tax=Gloeothece verrucosa (strain PCC 7822) TaxID=497965 RepID=E0UMC2_GLOV7|nr:single-stranded DNA-binding protein [Gloeothece verrucosa]ADN18102.1 single-strand binding protein [Gloeothece verrucosa PCC 7822]
MNNNINQISVTGRLGQDPEIRYFQSGSVLAKFNLADDRGEGKNAEANWFPCEVWGKAAEVAGDYCSKGSLVGVKGELTIESWTDNSTGEVRTKPVIKVKSLELLVTKNSTSQPALATGVVSKPNF